MKNNHTYIIILIVLIVSQSCIKEDFGNCPNWGKYKVGFYTKSNVNYLSTNCMLLFYSGIDSLSAPVLNRNFLMQNSSEKSSPHLLKLFPGEYNFCALLSGEEEILNNRVKLKNGRRYLYASTKEQIKKSPLNKVSLHFNLANSMIVIKCSMDSSLNDCDVSEVKISPPQEENAILNLCDGTCCFEQYTTAFFENSIYDTNEKEWAYYCNPLEPGNELSFKIILLDSISQTNKILAVKVFLNTGLEQGKVYKFHLNITPHKIEYKSSTIIDWDNYIHYEDIEL